MSDNFDRGPSHMCGVTLMNVPLGEAMARAMGRQSHIEVEHLPSMIRVDGKKKMEFDLEEISEEFGEDVGPPEFEEVMSTHYGRMVVDDEHDKILFFADPEDAAEYIGFDLVPVS